MTDYHKPAPDDDAPDETGRESSGADKRTGKKSSGADKKDGKKSSANDKKSGKNASEKDRKAGKKPSEREKKAGKKPSEKKSGKNSAPESETRRERSASDTERESSAPESETDFNAPAPDSGDFDDFRWEDFPDDNPGGVLLPADAAPTSRRPFQRPWTLPERLLLLFLLWLALGAALLLTVGHGAGLDAVRRYLRYGSRDNAARMYSYPASPSARFAALGDTLVVLTDTSLRLIGADGDEIWSQPVRMSSPALSTNGNRVAAWDVGGSELYALSESGPLLSLTADDDGPFLAARFNRNGWLSVTTGRQGYKGAVRVYDMRMKPVFEFHSSRRFVMDACVLNDNRRVAALTLGQSESVFVTDAVYYRLDEKEPETNCEIPDALPLELRQNGAGLTAVCDTCLVHLTADGAISARYDYDGAWLREYDTGGDGFTALYLSRYQSGSVGKLVTVDDDGAELGSVEVMEEVVDISAAGHYLAALYTDRLVVYNLALGVYASLGGAENVRGVMMRSDGSALLLGDSSAQLFLP